MSKNNYSKNLVKNTFILSLNKLIAPLISFLLLPIYTNNISTSEYGITDIIQTYVTLLVPILLLRLDVGMFRFIIERREDKKAISEIVTNTIAIVTPIIALASIILTIASIFNILPFQIATVFYFLNVMANNIIGPLTRGLGKNTLFSIGAIAEIFSNLIFSTIFVLILKMGGLGLMLSWSLSTLINNIICMAGIKSEFSFNRNLLNKSLRKELIKLSAPIIADGVSFWVINTSDRTIITLILGASANGIYAIANKFSNLIGSATSIFWLSWNEQASVAIKDDNYSAFVSKVFNSYFKIVTSIAMIVIAIIPFLFRITINPDYGKAISYIPFLIIGLFLNSIATFYGPIYLAHKKSKEVATSTTIAAIINLLVDLALVWFIGIWAAVISTIIAYLFILAYRVIDVRKIIKIEYHTREIISSIIPLIICIILYYISNPFIIFLNITLSAIVASVLNKDIISKLVHSIKIRLIKPKNSC